MPAHCLVVIDNGDLGAVLWLYSGSFAYSTKVVFRKIDQREGGVFK